jgi:uncharacterized membrane protein (DUF373 family)
MNGAKDARPVGVMGRVVGRFEDVAVFLLMCLLMVVVAISILELGWLLFRDLTTAGTLLVDVDEMLELFGFFLLVLVGLELLTTLKSYLYDRVIHVEVVLEVSLIAVAQKVIILDTRSGGPTLFGLAGLVIALAVAFWVVRIARRRPPSVMPGGAAGTRAPASPAPPASRAPASP